MHRTRERLVHDRRSMVPPSQHAIRALISHHGRTHGTPTKAVHPTTCTFQEQLNSRIIQGSSCDSLLYWLRD